MLRALVALLLVTVPAFARTETPVASLTYGSASDGARVIAAYEHTTRGAELKRRAISR